MVQEDLPIESKAGSNKKPIIKKWWKYIFEFVMLFLAVTLGFFVDNIREENADRNLELQHMQSLFLDLQQDTAMFREQIKILKGVTMMCDSVILLTAQKERSAHEQQRLYFLTRRMTPRIAPNFVNERAFDEMRSSGALRLIHSKNIADSISKYYFSTKELIWLNDVVADRSQRKIEVEAKVFKVVVFDSMINKETLKFSPPKGNPSLITNDQLAINEFAMSIHFISAVCIYKKNFLQRLTVDANRLLATLLKEYPDLK
jgi:hypothetical protein